VGDEVGEMDDARGCVVSVGDDVVGAAVDCVGDSEAG